MEPTFTVIDDGSATMRRYAMAANKSFEQVFLQASKGAVKHVISITPPASASGVPGGLDSGSQAKARGVAAVGRDLRKLFAPVRLKGKRKERISGVEMVSIHQRALSAKRPGAQMRRDRSQPYYVDRRKFNELVKKQVSHVGRMASGWVSAADRLGAAVPAWIKRHGSSRGSITLEISSNGYAMTALNITSAHSPAWLAPETQRRANYAAKYAINDLRRQIPHVNASAARQAGLTAA